MTEKPYWHELFAHMSQEHGLTLLESEMEEIAHIVDKRRGWTREIAKLKAQLKDYEMAYRMDTDWLKADLKLAMEMAGIKDLQQLRGQNDRPSIM